MKVSLMLFVTGSIPRSLSAIQSVRRIVESHSSNGWELIVVDVAENPEEAEEHRIIATPTLLRVSPPPARRLIGDIGDEKKLLEALGLAAMAESGG